VVGSVPQPDTNSVASQTDQAAADATKRAKAGLEADNRDRNWVYSMKRRLLLNTLLASAWMPARAALEIGERAPDFSAAGALAGRPIRFSLAESLARGPVVLYFFPAAFSEGFSIEAHNFAEATSRFEALGASVVGVSGDDIETLTKFSVQACQNKFAVVSDATRSVMKAFDAVMQTRPEYANRVSYVIAPSGAIVFVYSSLNPARHVERTLAAVRDYAAGISRP
jgi:peroxiredoxin